ncbi:ArnT family glycosyltransferase [Rhodoplanes sp. SY1]|uniref:ArnT family glycosyltransferase n=1 Tax=Rhodoplanes sp. SY1 TaxID=3166646 RepID=UPI0038B69444
MPSALSLKTPIDAVRPATGVPAPARKPLDHLPLLVVILLALTALRLVGLRLSIVDLFYDEAQYWSWAQNLAFGYYSKPPLLAWIIWGTERVCGEAEWCVRAPAPIFYCGTSLVVYAIGRALYDERTGFWAALMTALTTGAAFSSRIVSTDVPLLFFWAVALYAYVRLLEAPRWRHALLMGVATGLGLLAKYAMIYIVPGLVIAAIVSPRARALLRGPHVWVALLVALVVVSPNLIWNAATGFITFKHTGGLVIGEEVRWSALRALEFLGAQFGVFGPVIFGVMIVVTVRLLRGRLPEADRVMIAFSLFPIALVTAFAVTVHAYANWAAVAFVSGVVVAAATLVRERAFGWITTSLVIGGVTQALLLVGDVVADRVALPLLKNPNPYSRTLGWRDFAEKAGAAARAAGATAIVSDSRGDLGALLYYLRDAGIPVLSWRTEEIPSFDLGTPYGPRTSGPVLLVTVCRDQARIRPHVATVEPLGLTRTGEGTGGPRGFHAFRLTGPKDPLPPLAVCPWP